MPDIHSGTAFFCFGSLDSSGERERLLSSATPQHKEGDKSPDTIIRYQMYGMLGSEKGCRAEGKMHKCRKGRKKEIGNLQQGENNDNAEDHSFPSCFCKNHLKNQGQHNDQDNSR